MAIPTTTEPNHQRLLFCAYRKPDMSEQGYHKHLSVDHPALVSEMMVRYGYVQYTIVRTFTAKTHHFSHLPY
jgi:hypothetical protein